jgi:putative ABC transport system ATP-binding protein
MRIEQVAARCEGLVRIYWSASGEVHALKGVDAVIPAGRLTAITGPSGSGKSSLLRILAAQDRPTAGRAEVAGQSLAGLSTHRLRALRRRQIGYVFPRPPQNLLPQLTVAEHLVAAARIRGRGADDVDELLERLGLADRRAHRPGELSGGEQQRTAFAAALVGQPALVVADEPTSELDSTTTAGLLAAVHDVTRGGTTVVMATHDPLAAAAADQVIHLRSGAVAHEEVGGRRLAVIDGDGRLQLPEEALALFPDRRVVLELGADGVVLREPS